MSRLPWLRPLLRWLPGLGSIAAGLWVVKSAMFHAWVAGGPPTDYPEWHLHWAGVYLAVGAALLLLGALLLWLLRPRAG